MALKIQSSFSTGELDPALHERTTLAKYASGLATGRNVVIGKTGRIVTRPGRKKLLKTKLSNRKVLLYSSPQLGYFLEWGHLYVRVYDMTGTLIGSELTHDWTEDDLAKIHFCTSGPYFVYAFCDGKQPKKLKVKSGVVSFITPGTFLNPTGPMNTSLDVPNIPYADTSFTFTTGGTGYDVQYIATFVIEGQESYYSGVVGMKLPISSGQKNVFYYRLDGASSSTGVTEIRVYRRPVDGGAFGYIGSSTNVWNMTGPTRTIATFTDYGQEADYTHQPPDPIAPPMDFTGLGIISPPFPVNWNPRTGTIYQQRLLLTSQYDVEAIFASRPGQQNNFQREYPSSAASALQFKSGTSGNAKVLRMIDSDGLVVFTTVGVFLNAGVLGPDNLALDKKGNWIIDDAVPPLAIPGGVLFVDAATNSVRHLKWAENQSFVYTAEELSIFSNHMFTGKKITSWGFQEGDIAALWVTFNDGTFASLTFDVDQQMKAWTRHDSVYPVEQVCGTGYADKMLFVVNKNGERYIEMTVPRYVSASLKAANTEAEIGESVAALDGMVSWSGLLSLSASNTFTLTPIVAGNWDGSLTLTCGTAGIFTTGTYGAIGTKLRWFNPVDHSAIDLTVTARASNNSVTVTPSATFPSTYSTNVRLYETKAVFTGLDHLNGETPSIIVDGYVVSSPNNDVEDYPSTTVAGGSLTLPAGLRGAIVHIGRPITNDWETLDIDTVEQRPVLIESKIVTKLYLKSFDAGTIYAGAKFPALNKVDGMEEVGSIEVDYEDPFEIIANRYQPPGYHRYEVTIPGDWKSQGRVCFRNVDPLHCEVLSIIPDLEDERRYDR